MGVLAFLPPCGESEDECLSLLITQFFVEKVG